MISNSNSFALGGNSGGAAADMAVTCDELRAATMPWIFRCHAPVIR